MGSNDYVAPTPKNPARYLLPDSRAARAARTDAACRRGALARLLTDAGWVDLDNRRGATVADGRVVSLVGVDDPHLDLDRYPGRRPRPGDAVLRLGVTHAPYQRGAGHR